jgi:hypothetical protein
MENVARLYTHNQGHTRNEIIDFLTNIYVKYGDIDIMDSIIHDKKEELAILVNIFYFQNLKFFNSKNEEIFHFNNECILIKTLNDTISESPTKSRREVCYYLQ